MRLACVALCLTLIAPGCGGPPPARPPVGGTVPVVGHVFIVVEENADYTNVIDSPAMPYLNGLAARYGLATQYYANTHPSIGNYFMMTVGKIVTNNDGYSGTVSDDNIVRHLLAAGKTWKAYAEDLPAVGYHAAGASGKYASRHNPLSYLSDFVNAAAQPTNLVRCSQCGTDREVHEPPQRDRPTVPVRGLDPVRHAWAALAGLVVAAVHAVGQPAPRADVSTGGRYVWHGLSRAAELGAQPSLAAELRAHRLSLQS